jgi:hypothetical protein
MEYTAQQEIHEGYRARTEPPTEGAPILRTRCHSHDQWFVCPSGLPPFTITFADAQPKATVSPLASPLSDKAHRGTLAGRSVKVALGRTPGLR